MKFPKSIYIGANEWTISVYSNKTEFAKVAVSSGLSPFTIGFCSYSKREIALLKELPHEMLHTLLHEIKHAHQFESGLNQLISNDVMEMDAQGFASLVTGLFEIEFKKPKRKTSK